MFETTTSTGSLIVNNEDYVEVVVNNNLAIGTNDTLDVYLNGSSVYSDSQTPADFLYYTFTYNTGELYEINGTFS